MSRDLGELTHRDVAWLMELAFKFADGKNEKCAKLFGSVARDQYLRLGIEERANSIGRL